MSKINITLGPGNRGFITGSSGSGKTTVALALVDAMPSPRIILDTKRDPGIKKWAERNNIQFFEGLPDWKKIEDDLIVQPNPEEIADPDLIDQWLGNAFFCKWAPSIYIDEGYQSGASNRKLGVGVTGLWTRGRALGFCTLIGTQRPAWISSFVITESDHYYCMRLTDDKDREKMAGFMNNVEVENPIKQKYFWYCEQGDDAVLCNPLNLKEVEKIEDERKEQQEDIKSKKRLII